MIAPDSSVVEFAPYAISQTKAASDACDKMSPEVQTVARRIIWQLAENPGAHPMWNSTVDGASVYSHPDPPVQVTYTLDEKRKILNVLHVAAPLRPRRMVFISYSHSDTKRVAFVKDYLTVLVDQGLITLWDDTEIEAGDDWAEKIDAALRSACAAVLIVSQQFLGSDFIQKNELPVLLSCAQRYGTKIFWIHISPSTVFLSHPQITAFQSPLPNPEKSLWERKSLVERQRACVKISEFIQRALSA
jgi:hypothetical protein